MPLTIAHNSVTSPIFELVKVIEFDVQIGDDGYGIRVELLQEVLDGNRFRARLWRNEFFRIQSTFQHLENTGESTDRPSDEAIFVESDDWLSGKYVDFWAETPESALQTVLNDFRNFLVHTMGTED